MEWSQSEQRVNDNQGKWYSFEPNTEPESDSQSKNSTNQIMGNIKLNLYVNDEKHINSCHCPACLDEDQSYRDVMSSLINLLDCSSSCASNVPQSHNMSQEPAPVNETSSKIDEEKKNQTELTLSYVHSRLKVLFPIISPVGTKPRKNEIDN